MKIRKWLAASALSAGLVVVNPPTSVAADADTTTPAFGFSTLKPAAPEAAKAKCIAWLQSVGKYNPTAVDAIWAKENENRPLVDRVADTLALADPEVATLLATARNPDAAAPAKVPAFVKDAKQDPFVRANLALAFAKASANKKAYEETLEALNAVAPEQVVDPASFFFYKAVAAHATMQKDEATAAINRLRNDVQDPPDRYRMVAILLYFDMEKWSPDPKDLSNIERLMDNSGRRLDLARPDDKTQQIQRKIVFRLDELIKEKENQGGGSQQANGGQCPGGGKPGPGQGQGQGNGNNPPTQPAPDSKVMGGAGQNKDINKELQLATQNWGNLPPEERKKIVDQIAKDYPAKYKPLIDDYFKSLNRAHGFSNPSPTPNK